MDSDENKAILLIDKAEEEIDNSLVVSLSKSFKGIVAAFLAIVCLTISAVSVQLLKKAIPDLELNVMRYLVPFPFCCTWMMWKRQLPWIPKSELPGIMLYCTTGFTTSITYFSAISYLPVATVQCIVVTVTILSGIFAFAVFLKEKPGILTFLFASLCVVGAIMVIQPSPLFANTSLNLAEDGNISYGIIEDMNKSDGIMGDSEANRLQEPTRENRTDFEVNEEENISKHDEALPDNTSQYEVWTTVAIVLSIVCGAVNAVDVIVVKKFPYLAGHISDALFWAFAANIIFSGILMLFIESPVIPAKWSDVILAFLHSIFSALTWLLYIYSVNVISGNTYNLISSTTALFQFTAQYTILSSILPGHRNWIEVVGVILVTMGSLLGSLLELWKSKYGYIFE